jgi:hypothetical protein
MKADDDGLLSRPLFPADVFLPHSPTSSIAPTLIWMPSFLSTYRPPRARPTEATVFPAEITRHILSYADPTSLARACGASYDLLRIASHLLYRDVEIVGLERLRRLFCDRVSLSLTCHRS